MSLPSTRYLYLRWPFFFMKHSWINSLNMPFSLEGREVKCFNAFAGGEGPRLYVLLTDLDLKSRMMVQSYHGQVSCKFN
jgi:hypothetical protein